jgi:hypothetical protein
MSPGLLSVTKVSPFAKVKPLQCPVQAAAFQNYPNRKYG